MTDKKPTYEELRHTLDSKMLKASELATEQEQQDFVASAFTDIHRDYETKRIDHTSYTKLINRLAAYKAGAYNDYLDTLTGAALVGMLDIILEQSKRSLIADLSRKRSQTVTDITGVQPIRPDKEKEHG